MSSVLRGIVLVFQSTLPVWGGTAKLLTIAFCSSISIHPPRVGRDNLKLGYGGTKTISIHPPRVGRDPAQHMIGPHKYLFQSTLPVWGGTPLCPPKRLDIYDFNPPSPCGEGLWVTSLCVFGFVFQSTLPVWGGTWRRRIRRLLTNFNPPSPWGEGPDAGAVRNPNQNFNPPSPCGEGPEKIGLPAFKLTNFNPPSPWGEGPRCLMWRPWLGLFQSTLPVGGGTFRRCTGRLSKRNFNPPSPWGEGRMRWP